MLGLSFRRWDTKATGLFVWYRVYWNHKWTPLVWAIPRYNSGFTSQFRNR